MLQGQIYWIKNLMWVGVSAQGFAIGSAALVSLALFGAYVSRAGIATVNVIEPEVRMEGSRP